MRELVEDMITVDWTQVRVKRAVGGLASMLIIALLGQLLLDSFGDPTLAALLAVVFTTAAGGSGSMSERLPGMIRFTVIGAAIGGLAWFSTESEWFVAATLGVATYLGTLASAGGPPAARAGLFLTIWPLVALMFGSRTTDPWTIVVGFMVGGVVAIAMTAVRLRFTADDDAADAFSADASVSPSGSTWWERTRSAVRSPIGTFSLIRATAVAIATLVGWALFSSHPLWVAITVIVVVKPSVTQSVTTAAERTLGTAAGFVAAVAVARVLAQSDVAVVIAFLVSGVLMVAFNNANYTLFAASLTSTLVLGQQLAQGDASQAGWQRFLATVVGVLLSLAVGYLGVVATRRAGPTIEAR